jgi:hypothetical protein
VRTSSGRANGVQSMIIRRRELCESPPARIPRSESQ